MIKMTGIDHSTASVDIRAIFSIRKSELSEFMSGIKKRTGATGVVVISTCNRMEVWVSMDRDADLFSVICDCIPAGNARGAEAENFRELFSTRTDNSAIEHLMWLTGGLKSAILAEDQILSQVKDAADFARAERHLDHVLEVLFRTAISAAKKIKTNVIFHRANTSAIDAALHFLSEKGFDISGKKCMVIGNGEYGRLVADTLVEEGADVTVTIRQYHSGEVLIPKGCRTILYGDKFQVFPECDLVVSATASPNYTLFYDAVRDCQVAHPMALIDLAVPRDIDPRIAELEQYSLYNIDDFKSEDNPENESAFAQAEAIIKEKLEEFHAWYDYHDAIPLIARIKEDAVSDIEARLEKTMRKLSASPDEKETLRGRVEDAAGKVISNLFYKMRDELDDETFRACLSVFAETAAAD